MALHIRIKRSRRAEVEELDLGTEGDGFETAASEYECEDEHFPLRSQDQIASAYDVLSGCHHGKQGTSEASDRNGNVEMHVEEGSSRHRFGSIRPNTNDATTMTDILPSERGSSESRRIAKAEMQALFIEGMKLELYARKLKVLEMEKRLEIPPSPFTQELIEGVTKGEN